MAIPESDFPPETGAVQPILWEAPVLESGITIIDGRVRNIQGSLELEWIVDASMKAELQTYDSSGSAELPMHEVRIWPVSLADGTALLAKEFYPLLNSRQPVSVKVVGIVQSENLFAPLGLVEIPLGSMSHHEMARITFGRQYESQGTKVMEGVIAHQGGTRRLLWQKALNGSFQVVSVEKGMEIPLIPMLDKKSATAFIFEKRSVELQGIGIDYLWYVGKTVLDDFLEGFRRL